MIKSYTDHAANERTFLAWIRTGLTIMALGFVIERLDLFLAGLAADARGRDISAFGQAEIHYLSVVLVVLGIVLIVGSAYRFVDINRAIDEAVVLPFKGIMLPVGMSAVLVVAGIALLLYLLRLI